MTLSTVLTIVFAGTLLYVPCLLSIRARVLERTRQGSLAHTRAQSIVDLACVVLLVFGLANVYIALPHAHPDAVAPAFVRVAALPLAYIVVALGAALRLTVRERRGASVETPAR